MPYANNKGADQPAHSHSLISAFVVRCLDSMIPLVSIPEISSLYLASVTVHTGLSLPLSQTPKTGFLMARLIFHKTHGMKKWSLGPCTVIIKIQLCSHPMRPYLQLFARSFPTLFQRIAKALPIPCRSRNDKTTYVVAKVLLRRDFLFSRDFCIYEFCS